MLAPGWGDSFNQCMRRGAIACGSRHLVRVVVTGTKTRSSCEDFTRVQEVVDKEGTSNVVAKEVTDFAESGNLLGYDSAKHVIH